MAIVVLVILGSRSHWFHCCIIPFPLLLFTYSHWCGLGRGLGCSVRVLFGWVHGRVFYRGYCLYQNVAPCLSLVDTWCRTDRIGMLMVVTVVHAVKHPLRLNGLCCCG